MKHSLATLTLLACAALAQGQSCYSAPTYQRSYSYSQSYTPAVTYGTPTYYAPAKTYKAYEADYTPTVLRFVLALPVANLPSYGAAYSDPHALAPAPQAQAPPAAKATGQESQMQQVLASQGQILEALKKLDDRTRAVEQRLERLERTRQPLDLPQQPKERRQEEQGPPPKEEPTSGDLDRAFAVVDAASCAACHRRSNAAKHGGGFVFTEDDGRMAKLTADQREEVERQITSGKMPKLKTTRAKEASVKPLTQTTADVVFKSLDRQKLSPKRKEQAAE